MKKLFSPILFSIYFLSGFSALLYQVIWQRILTLFSGSDSLSVSIVVSAFLLGLGIGNIAGGFFSLRLNQKQSIYVFAAAELLIGLFAVISPYLFHEFLLFKLQPFTHHQAFIFLIIFSLLIIPTALMGSTLPLISQGFIKEISMAARQVTLLNGLNMLGACTGAFIGSWLIIGNLGLKNSLYFASGINVFIAITVFSLVFSNNDQYPIENYTSKPKDPIFSKDILIWCTLLFCSGFLFISYEIIWFRLLDIIFKSQSYTFGHVISYFLAFNGLGHIYAFYKIRKGKLPTDKVSYIKIFTFTGLVSFVLIFFMSLALSYPELSQALYHHAHIRGNTKSIVILIAMPLLILGLPCFLMGFHFPLSQAALQKDQHAIGQNVGIVLFFNILGNTFGGLVTGLLLLKYVGTSLTLKIFTVLLLIIIGILRFKKLLEKKFPFIEVFALVLLAVCFFPNNSKFWPVFHGAFPVKSSWVSENETGVSVLLEKKSGGATLFAHGHAQATIPFFPFQGVMGAIGPLIHPKPEHILVIGLGTGGTAYGANINSRTRTINVIELLSSEIDVLKQFNQLNHNDAINSLFKDPKYNIIIGDGRKLLIDQNQTYDVITVHTQNPRSSRSGTLYSLEFFNLAKNKLSTNGLFVQWAPTKRVENTFVQSFPYVVKIQQVLVGSKTPIPVDKQGWLKKIKNKKTWNYLKKGGFKAKHYLGYIRKARIKTWAQQKTLSFNENEINTDLFPRDEFFINN